MNTSSFHVIKDGILYDNRELPPGTVADIVAQAGLTAEEFLKHV